MLKMILPRDFFFVRHGQTDYNRLGEKTDHGDIPLNATGRKQAKSLAPLIMQLQLRTICCSPLRRTRETKEFLVPPYNFLPLEIDNLGECTAQIWHEMTSLGSKALVSGSPLVKSFLHRAKQGVNEALAQQGPVLIVSHGGVHWALCCWMGITNYDWLTGNGQLTHFSLDHSGKWKAKILQESGAQT